VRLDAVRAGSQRQLTEQAAAGDAGFDIFEAHLALAEADETAHRPCDRSR
jgi:hypothetical protein